MTRKLHPSISSRQEALKLSLQRQPIFSSVAANWTELDSETTRTVLESYLQAYSFDGTMTDEALEAAIQMELECSKLQKKLPISQVALRTLLLQAPRELGLLP